MEFDIEPRGPFSLGQSARFLQGFTPAAGGVAAEDGRLNWAFRLDGTFEPVGVSLWQDRGRVQAEVVGTRDLATVRAQVARMLSLDPDGSDYERIGESDPVVGQAQAELPGLRPVLFSSPYEAAIWGLITQRIQMTQAAQIKRELSEQVGDTVEIGGQQLPVVPSPEQLLRVKIFPGLDAEKLERLHSLARAALLGRLEAKRLRSQKPEIARTELQDLRGVGSWTAEHILIRGAGAQDELPYSEPRVHRAVELAYRLDSLPNDEQLFQTAQNWRPFRTWVAVLLVVQLGRAGQWDASDRRGGRRGMSVLRSSHP